MSGGAQTRPRADPPEGRATCKPHRALENLRESAKALLHARDESLRLPRCVSTGPVGVRLAERANERESERTRR